jgi:hypothetical protein
LIQNHHRGTVQGGNTNVADRSATLTQKGLTALISTSFIDSIGIVAGAAQHGLDLVALVCSPALRIPA